MLGLYAANSVGDDIEFYADDARGAPLMTWHGLRVQTDAGLRVVHSGEVSLRPLDAVR